MHTLIQPDGCLPAKGYGNGVLVSNGSLYVGGQIGRDGDQVLRTHDFAGQMEQALLNIKSIVETASGTVESIVRLTWYVTDKKKYLARQGEVGEAYRRVFGRHFPSMKMIVVKDLIEDTALVEIEATAVLDAPGA